MPLDAPLHDLAANPLEAYEPERFWAIWQHPESRYAYMVGLRRDAWLILIDTEGTGMATLLEDARMNRRAPSDYRLDELTLPDAFAAARTQSVPFRTSYGGTVRDVRGVEIRSAGRLQHLPL